MSLATGRYDATARFGHWVRPTTPVAASVRKRSYGTLTFVALLAVMMCIEMLSGVSQLRMLFADLGLRSEAWSWTDFSSYGRMLSYAFLHSDGQHFFWNAMLILLVGSIVESRIGLRGVLALFIVGSVVSAASQIVMFPNETRPLIGASGIGAALFGTVMILSGQVGFSIRLPGPIPWIDLTLRRVILTWAALQIIGLTLFYASPDASIHVAYWAHLAGFAVGIAGGYVFTYLNNASDPEAAEPPFMASFGSAGD